MKRTLQHSSDTSTGITINRTPGYITKVLPLACQYFNDSAEIMSFEHIFVGSHDVTDFVAVRSDAAVCCASREYEFVCLVNVSSGQKIYISDAELSIDQTTNSFNINPCFHRIVHEVKIDNFKGRPC